MHILAAVAIVLGTWSCAALGAVPDSPDVLVLVLSGMGPYDQVSINYATSVPVRDTRQDLATLKRATGWLIQNERITTQTARTPGAHPTTSATFQTPTIVNTVNGLLPLEPFIATLKRFESIRVNYLVASEYKFRGLKDFENEYVNIGFERTGNSYLYSVRVKDKSFDRLGLPPRPVENVPVHRRGMPAGARIMLILGFALLGAALAYIAAVCVGKSRRTLR